MSAGKYNIIIEQGSTFTKDITLKDHAGVVINLTGCTFAAQCRQKASDASPLFSFTAVCSAPTTGKFTLSLTSVQTSAFNFKPAVYDVEITYPGSIVKRVLEGSVVLSKEVTR